MNDETNETPAPLSDADIAMLQLTWERYRHDPMPMFSGDIVGQLLATLAAYREIVAAVADGWSNALGTRIGKTPADGLALKSRARALLGTQTPGTTGATGATGATAGEEGEA